MRNRIPTLLAAGVLAASLAACSSEDEPDVALSPDPGNASTEEGSEPDTQLLGDVDPAHCDVVRRLDEEMDQLQLSAEANHELDQADVEQMFAPVQEVLADLPPQFHAAVVVLNRVARSAAMPMTDQAALEERFAHEETTQAMTILDETTQQACGE